MRPEDLKELLSRQPFIPLRIHMTDGKAFEIHHPDLVLVSRYSATIGVGPDETSGVVDHVEHCALLHVVRVEELSGNSHSRRKGKR